MECVSDEAISADLGSLGLGVLDLGCNIKSDRVDVHDKTKGAHHSIPMYDLIAILGV